MQCYLEGNFKRVSFFPNLQSQTSDRRICRRSSQSVDKTDDESDEWLPLLEEAVEAAIAPASVEVLNGQLNSIQLSEQIDRKFVITAAQTLLELTYHYSNKELPAIITTHLAELPGGQDWYEGKL